jgi:hypothetical protein
VPKGKSAADDLAVRLDWPHAAAPLATERGSGPAGEANGKAGEPAGLALVVERLDALIAQVRALTLQVEALTPRPTADRAEERDAAEENAPVPPARRPAARRRPT